MGCTPPCRAVKVMTHSPIPKSALFLTPRPHRIAAAEVVHQACCRAHHTSDPACSAVMITYIYRTLQVFVVPCWQPSTALTNPHTTAPQFVVLFSSICCIRTSAQPTRFMLYLCCRQSRAAVYLASGRMLANVGDLRRYLGCSWRQQGQIANRQAEVNQDAALFGILGNEQVL
jgi:hypothetical protein